MGADFPFSEMAVANGRWQKGGRDGRKEGPGVRFGNAISAESVCESESARR